MLRGLGALVRAQWRMLRREPGYWIVSVGLSATIIIVYGSVLSNPGGPELGVVLEDTSPDLREATRQLQDTGGIDVEIGSLEDELADLEDGERWAVIVFPDGTVEAAAHGGEARARVIYNDADPFQAAAGQGILRAFVSRLNDSLGQAADPDIDEQTIEGERGIGLLETLFPGLIGMSLMFGNSLAASMFVSWRQSGILKRISSAPVRPFTLELAQFMTLLVVSALQVIVLVTLAQTVFGVHVAGSYATLALVSLAGAVTFMGIWYALAALISVPTTFFAVMNLTAFIMMFLGGSVVPNDNVPGWLDPIIQAMPLTHLNDALRAVINDSAGVSSIAGKLAILAAWAVAGFALSTRLFNWGRA